MLSSLYCMLAMAVNFICKTAFTKQSARIIDNSAAVVYIKCEKQCKLQNRHREEGPTTTGQ